jgi:hypothetical protein
VRRTKVKVSSGDRVPIASKENSERRGSILDIKTLKEDLLKTTSCAHFSHAVRYGQLWS